MTRALAALLLMLSVSPARAAQVGLSPGGSNYNWYAMPYGIIANYDAWGVRDAVRAQLATMFQDGQRVLTVSIYHSSGLNTGTVMDSSGGNLSSRQRANLAAFLADIRAAGFDEILISFKPIGPNDPTNATYWNQSDGVWSSFDEAMFQENWNLIYNLHSGGGHLLSHRSAERRRARLRSRQAAAV